jgi:hypothetical protein
MWFLVIERGRNESYRFERMIVFIFYFSLIDFFFVLIMAWCLIWWSNLWLLPPWILHFSWLISCVAGKKTSTGKQGAIIINYLGGGSVVRVWDQEVCSLYGLRFKLCSCSYDGHWKLTWSLTSGSVGLVEVRASWPGHPR